MNYYRPTIAEIDLNAITHNVKFFKGKVGNEIELIAVVKADAYGHGVVPVSKHLETIGIRYFAVAFLDEALQLRKSGVKGQILVLGYTPRHGIEIASENDITLTVFSLEMVRDINEIGERVGKKLKVHLKVDTGMGRLGITPDSVIPFITTMLEYPWVQLEGIFTHFATADEKDKSFTFYQYDLFTKAMNDLKNLYHIPYIHISNSAAMIDLSDIEQSMS